MAEEKNGDGTYREPADVEQIPEYATTSAVVVLRAETDAAPRRWGTAGAPDPVLPSGPCHWSLISTQAVQLETWATANRVEAQVRTGKESAVLFVWTRHRRVED